MTEPTLDELMLAYDRMDRPNVDFERLLRGGMVTMQGVPTQEGERALIRAYRSRAIGLERRIAALVTAGNRLAGITPAHPIDPEVKRQWRKLAKGDA